MEQPIEVKCDVCGAIVEEVYDSPWTDDKKVRCSDCFLAFVGYDMKSVDEWANKLSSFVHQKLSEMSRRGVSDTESGELAGNTYLPKDPDEYVSWAYKQRGGLQLIADRMRRSEEENATLLDQISTLKKGIRFDGQFEVAFLDAYLNHFKKLREKADKYDAIMSIMKG